MGQKHRWCRILLIGFFLFMLAGTVISRIYDSASVPKVVTTYLKRKSIETIITGTGTVRENEVVFCEVNPGIRIESVSVSPGSEVKAGDELFRFQMSSLQSKKEDLETELTKARLGLERMDISAETYAQVSQSELASRELLLAQQELAEAQQDYQAKWAEHFVNLKNLEDEYARKQAMSDEELLMQQDQQLESVRVELRTARASRDAEIADAERQIEDLKAKLEAADEGGSLPDNGGAENGSLPDDVGAGSGNRSEGGDAENGSRSDSENVNEDTPDAAGLRQELARAEVDLKSLKEQWDLRISDIRTRYDMLELQTDRILNGETSSQAALQESYEAAVKQEEAAWESVEENLAALQQKEADAQWNLDIAARQDEYTRLTAAQQARLLEIDRRLQELTISGIEQQIARLDELIAAEGRVVSEIDGTVIDQEVTAGRTSSGEERLSVAYGNRIFEAEFDKQEQALSVGDLIDISIPGSSRTVEARIGSMSLLGEKTGVFQADLEELGLPIGTVTSYQCRRVSDTYQKVIPLSALRKDMMGYYCLAVRTKSAVMGEEFWAERIDLTILYQGSSEAAVEGALLDSDQLITAGSQVIVSGDRVRPVDSLQE